MLSILNMILKILSEFGKHFKWFWSNDQETPRVPIQTVLAPIQAKWILYPGTQRILRNSEILLWYSCILCCLSNWNVSNTWLNHIQAKTNACFCAIHASVKVVKMNKTIWKNICLLEKKINTSGFKSTCVLVCHKESQHFTVFLSGEGNNLMFN